jgi:hypothetical protein
VNGIELVIALIDEAADAAMRLEQVEVKIYDVESGDVWSVGRLTIEGGELQIELGRKVD